MASVHGAQPSGSVQELFEPAWQMRWRVPELALMLGDRAVAQARRLGDRSLRLRAEALTLFASNRLGQGVAVTGRAIAAVRDAEAAGEHDIATELRVELACCARTAGGHDTALRILQPVLERERIEPALRAHAMIELAASLPGKRQDGERAEALNEAERLYGSTGELNLDTSRVLLARVRTARAGHLRRNGDFEGAANIAETGLALLEGLGDPAAESGEIHARLVLERVHSLLDLGHRAEAVDAAVRVIRTPVRAASAGPSGWLRLALATRVHLPSGEHGAAVRLLNDAAANAERHKLDCLLSESLSMTSQAHERAEEFVDALACLRRAYSADRRWRAAVHAARVRLLEEFPALADSPVNGTAANGQRAAGATTAPAQPAASPARSRTRAAESPVVAERADYLEQAAHLERAARLEQAANAGQGANLGNPAQPSEFAQHAQPAQFSTPAHTSPSARTSRSAHAEPPAHAEPAPQPADTGRPAASAPETSGTSWLELAAQQTGGRRRADRAGGRRRAPEPAGPATTGSTTTSPGGHAETTTGPAHTDVAPAVTTTEAATAATASAAAASTGAADPTPTDSEFPLPRKENHRAESAAHTAAPSVEDLLPGQGSRNRDTSSSEGRDEGDPLAEYRRPGEGSVRDAARRLMETLTSRVDEDRGTRAESPAPEPDRGMPAPRGPEQPESGTGRRRAPEPDADPPAHHGGYDLPVGHVTSAPLGETPAPFSEASPVYDFGSKPSAPDPAGDFRRTDEDYVSPGDFQAPRADSRAVDSPLDAPLPPWRTSRSRAADGPPPPDVTAIMPVIAVPDEPSDPTPPASSGQVGAVLPATGEDRTYSAPPLPDGSPLPGSSPLSRDYRLSGDSAPSADSPLPGNSRRAGDSELLGDSPLSGGSSRPAEPAAAWEQDGGRRSQGRSLAEIRESLAMLQAQGEDDDTRRGTGRRAAPEDYPRASDSWGVDEPPRSGGSWADRYLNAYVGDEHPDDDPVSSGRRSRHADPEEPAAAENSVARPWESVPWDLPGSRGAAEFDEADPLSSGSGRRRAEPAHGGSEHSESAAELLARHRGETADRAAQPAQPAQPAQAAQAAQAVQAAQAAQESNGEVGLADLLAEALLAYENGRRTDGSDTASKHRDDPIGPQDPFESTSDSSAPGARHRRSADPAPQHDSWSPRGY